MNSLDLGATTVRRGPGRPSGKGADATRGADRTPVHAADRRPSISQPVIGGFFQLADLAPKVSEQSREMALPICISCSRGSSLKSMPSSGSFQTKVRRRYAPGKRPTLWCLPHSFDPDGSAICASAIADFCS